MSLISSMIAGNNVDFPPAIIEASRYLIDPTLGGMTTGAGVTVADTLYAHAFNLTFNLTATVKNVTASVTTIGVLSAFKGAIYKRSGNGLFTLISDSNPTGIDTTTTGGKVCDIVDISLAKGQYLLASLVSGTTGATYRSFSNGNMATAIHGGSNTSNIGGGFTYGFSQTQTYTGGFPATLDLSTMTKVSTAIIPQLAIGI